ncbi:MAG: hypothetical protein RL077_1232 [Verrucomicrobiota bacterium]
MNSLAGASAIPRITAGSARRGDAVTRKRGGVKPVVA